MVTGVLWRHFQSSAHMFANQLAGVSLCRLIGGRVTTVVQQQVIANTAADEAFFHPWQLVDGMIQVEQLLGISVKVGTDARVNA